MTKLKIKLGNSLLPALNRLMDALSPLINGITQLIEAFPNATAVIMGGVAVLAGIALVLAPVLTAAAALTGAFAYMRAMMAKLRLTTMATGATIGNKGGGFSTAANQAKGFLGKAGMVGAAGMAGWEIGSLINAGINKAVQYASDGKNKSFGGLVYDKLHPSSQQPIQQDNRATYAPVIHIHGGNPEDVKTKVLDAMQQHSEQHQQRVMSGLLFDVQGAH